MPGFPLPGFFEDGRRQGADRHHVDNAGSGKSF
jgi:hypothetical protein